MPTPQQSFNSGLQFLSTPPDSSHVYVGAYEPIWVGMSILLSILASYAALRAFNRIEFQHDRLSKLAWMAISAITLGFGVWGMHFIGMLALHLPCSIYYDPLTTLISILPGILAGGVALGVAWNQETHRLQPLLASLLFGAGIGAMHYTGMAAMRLEGVVRFDPTKFVVSLVVAVALSYLALRVKSSLDNLNNRSKLLIAVILGLAVSGMHYTAMSAAYFVRDEDALLPGSVFNPDTIGIMVALATVFLALGATTLASFSKNREITQQLRDSEERWKFAMEGAGDSIWDWNPQTDRIVFSKRWQEIIGCAEHEIPSTGSGWVENCHPEDKAQVWEAWHHYMTGDQASFAVEFRMPATDMPWKWILARGKLVSRDEAGNPLRVIGALTDISETKLLQIQLNQAQKLEAIGQLASGVAHEINTPIQYIGDNLSALNDNFNDLIAYVHSTTDAANDVFKTQMNSLADQYDLSFILEDSPKAIKQACEGVARVAEIVKAMKSFAHVDADAGMQRINLHEAINNALIISRNSYKYHAEIETVFSPEVGIISGYPNELNQVFLNLIVNAAHAIEEKQADMGLIHIETRKLADSIEILIADNGNGIAPQHQEKVFNLFFTTKAIGKGTGQGLSLSHSIIVDKHQGKLFFESSAGNGTTFHIQLPIIAA